MTATVKLIRRRSGFANVADGFATIEPGYDHAVDEFNEELCEYRLPSGYSVAKTNYGETAIFDAKNKYCNIVQHASGRPQLVSEIAARMPILERG